MYNKFSVHVIRVKSFEKHNLISLYSKIFNFYNRFQKLIRDNNAQSKFLKELKVTNNFPLKIKY